MRGDREGFGVDRPGELGMYPFAILSTFLSFLCRLVSGMRARAVSVQRIGVGGIVVVCLVNLAVAVSLSFPL